MTELKGHPIKRAQLHVFERAGSTEWGAKFIARFYPYDTWPIFFHGATHGEAQGKAEAFRSDCVERHEATVLRRQEQAAARKKKKEQSND